MYSQIILACLSVCKCMHHHGSLSLWVVYRIILMACLSASLLKNCSELCCWVRPVGEPTAATW